MSFDETPGPPHAIFPMAKGILTVSLEEARRRLAAAEETERRYDGKDARIAKNLAISVSVWRATVRRLQKEQRQEALFAAYR